MCYFRVTDAQTKRPRKCRSGNVRGGGLFINVCWVHSWDPAAKIQAAWRRFKTRKTVGVFKELPDDLWNEVLRHVVQRNRLPDLVRSHRKIYVRRLDWAMGSWETLYKLRLQQAMEGRMGRVQDIRNLMEKCSTSIVHSRAGIEWCDNLLDNAVKSA